MTRKLLPIVIRNPRRRGLLFRLRDAMIAAGTLGLWGTLAYLSFLKLTGQHDAAPAVFPMPTWKLLAVEFAAVFVLLHGWVLYESLLARRRLKGTSARLQGKQLGISERYILATYPNVLSYRSGWLVAIIFLTDIFA